MYLVSGATGNVGRHLVANLLAEGCPVRALTRDPATANLPIEVDVRSAHGSDPSSLAPVLDGVKCAFVMVNMPGRPEQGKNWANALRTSSVERVVLMSSLTLNNPDAADPVSNIHRANEAAIAATGISASFLRPGIFMSNALDWAPAIRDRGVVSIWPGNHPFAPVHEADIAALAAYAMTRDSAPEIITATGPNTLTPVDQVATLAEHLGRPLLVRELSTETALRMLGTTLPTGAEQLLDAMAGPDASWRRPAGSVERLLGRPGLTWDSWCREHTEHFLVSTH